MPDDNPGPRPAAAAPVPARRLPEAYLAEVFGFPADVKDPDVQQLRAAKLCPFRPTHPDAKRDLSTPDSRVPFVQQFARCTKDSKTDPLGVCSVYHGGKPAITCPVRFAEGGTMLQVTGDWAGPVMGVRPGELHAIPEVRLVPASPEAVALVDVMDAEQDQEGEQVPEVTETSAGNIDYVLAHVDAPTPTSTLVTDYAVNAYAALEVQAVYISGNVRNPFRDYMGEEENGRPYVWPGDKSPRPDWLSSSRKRLVPQLAWKGSVLHEWDRPIAVCVQDAFWQTMPYLANVTTPDDRHQELAWVIIDLERQGRLFQLKHVKTVYSDYDTALTAATKTPAGEDRLVRQVILRKYIEQTTGKKARLPKKPKPKAQAKPATARAAGRKRKA